MLPAMHTAKMGSGFMLVRSDVGGNIARLRERATADPARYDVDLYELVRAEIAAGTAAQSTSCTKGLLWLMR